jgi:hypothetical protein
MEKMLLFVIVISITMFSTATMTDDDDLSEINSTCWHSDALGATFDFPDDWEGLFTLKTTSNEISMTMVMAPPTDYGGMICFFLRDPASKWVDAIDNAPTETKIVAESDEFVIVMIRPGDMQAAPEYRDQYYGIVDRLDEVVVTFDE